MQLFYGTTSELEMNGLEMKNVTNTMAPMPLFECINTLASIIDSEIEEIASYSDEVPIFSCTQ